MTSKAQATSWLGFFAAVVLVTVTLGLTIPGCSDEQVIDCPGGISITSKGVPEGRTYDGNEIAVVCREAEAQAATK